MLISWLYNSTRGSVVIAMIFHAPIDTITLAFVFRLFSDVDQVRKWWLLAAVFSLAYGFSWLPSLIEARGILPLGPLVAALIVTAIIGRWTGVKSFLGRVGEGAVVVAYAAVWAAA